MIAKRTPLLLAAGLLAATLLLLAGCASSRPATTTEPMETSAAAAGSMAGEAAAAGSVEEDRLGVAMALDPRTAPRAVIDRFSAEAGTLMVRSAANGLPGPDQPIDFDRGSFITTGLGPGGEVVRYYNFDVQPTVPAPIHVLFREGEDGPVAGQLNIVDAIPGGEGYSDFWQVNRVTVPAGYQANSITSLEQIRAGGFPVEATSTLVNCPIVPEGSTARLRLGGESAGLHSGWYRGQVVHYFTFEERQLSATADGRVPVSPIFVAFNVNPDQPGGGPASGFRTEPGTEQTHNVLATLPSDAGYSPLWSVSPYDNRDFAAVRDLDSALAAKVLARGVAAVNCPVVSLVEGGMTER